MTDNQRIIYDTLVDKYTIRDKLSLADLESMSPMEYRVYIMGLKNISSVVLTKAQVSEELQIGVTKVDQLRANGDLKSIKVGSQIRFRFIDLAEYLGQ